MIEVMACYPMKTKWWKRDELFFLYGLLGAIVGAGLGLFLFGTVVQWAIEILHAEGGWQRAYSGVSGVFLLAQLAIFDTFLGAVTGCALVHVWGRYRQLAAWALVISGALAGLAAAMLGIDAASSYGRRFALSTDGVYFAWSVFLVCWGMWMIAKDINYCRSDLQ